MSEATRTPGQIVLSWWARDLGNNADFDTGAARKARAELRRADTASRVLALEATHRLYRHLIEAGAGPRFAGDNGPERLALIATVIAGLDAHARRSLPARFGEKQDDRPRLSHLRFQRILRAGDDWELAVRLRRALPLAGRTANVAGLGTDLLHWNENTRNRWCFDYFGAPPPGEDDAPANSEPLAATEQD
ncbi:type I-E CRISPR-associated protein Cse2/CasB [Aquibium sp. A9E412]|uniref:type I-E CRISPR-associated protein Cse2/CasB n=1 Tax=Aquibium sp. A9E412 TaxID=2976767 RepID=UPI0025B1CC04|nr:type I-E CRISPR-associated protein Cse2/CasB [Aquibium sp. A9E412]MDN2565200.1 type I-E CRISPR-associated protein Cse2/CasB [Aquibium sp. A9E412]